MAAVLWCRSFWIDDSLYVSAGTTYVIVGSRRGQLEFGITRRPDPPNEAISWESENVGDVAFRRLDPRTLMDPHIKANWFWAGFGYNRAYPFGYQQRPDPNNPFRGGWKVLYVRMVYAPHYSLVAFTAILAALFKLRWFWKFRRPRRGTCSNCGYDLRGSPGRCPECGDAAPPAAASTPTH
jgi:hypothetical protein